MEYNVVMFLDQFKLFKNPMEERSLNFTAYIKATDDVDNNVYESNFLENAHQLIGRIELGARIFSWIAISIFGICFISLIFIHWRSISHQSSSSFATKMDNDKSLHPVDQHQCSEFS
ncbi:hypothetical protein T11_1800 [Trichinella zimbabwensis]|uniref:Uncharacterized protein n=1 Tax=Trichinella zimbabwensis TaxID=268475 RepID=A0A0V1HUX1_9BILA|nr:hypothetical protein T11_1800 [Trichinella zimbabwensis]